MHLLLDSNMVIYLLDPKCAFLQVCLVEHTLHVSEISRVEVLGFSKLDENSYRSYLGLMDSLRNHGIARTTIDGAIDLRRKRKMSLGNALIAANAIEHQLTLATRNVRDFDGIAELYVFNPFSEDGARKHPSIRISAVTSTPC